MENLVGTTEDKRHVTWHLLYGGDGIYFIFCFQFTLYLYTDDWNSISAKSQMLQRWLPFNQHSSLNRIQTLRNLGYKLIEGPRSIFPPDVGYDWLEKDMSIYLHYFGDNRIQQISLWTDYTTNKSKNFLKPVIRFAHWERQNDFEGDQVTWPDIRIFLGYIKESHLEELNSKLIDIQKTISMLVFKPLGISLARNVVTLEECKPLADFEIYIRNGRQTLKYYSPTIVNDSFSSKVIDLKSLMLQSLDELDKMGWRERYDTPFDIATFDWDYQKINGR